MMENERGQSWESYPMSLKRARKMDYRAMLKTADMLHKKTGKSRIWLMADMAKCAAKYNAGYVDYKIAEMYRLNDAQRATQITRGISNNIVARMNDKKFWHFFDNKTEFNQLFHEQVKREWLNFSTTTEAQFAEFVQGRGDIICKPIDGSSGQGILKCTPEDYRDVHALYARLKAAGIGIVEDKVIQHEAIAALCPTSVNTIRVATLLGDKKEGIVYAYIRIGNGKVMDNVDCGGMAAPINLDTGVISGVGANKAGEAFEFHPMTGKRIPGTQIPLLGGGQGDVPEGDARRSAGALCRLGRGDYAGWSGIHRGQLLPEPRYSAVRRPLPGWRRHPAAIRGVYRPMICTLCPRNCGAERAPEHGTGVCRMGTLPKIARAALHRWEEPCISGTRGSGAVFFSGCGLRCVFCQNESISQRGEGKIVTPKRLSEIFRELEAQGAHNINLVTAAHFVPAVLDALALYRPSIPIVYNSSGYESVETLRMLEGAVDIYLPDYKYIDPNMAAMLSGARDYPDTAHAAIDEMVRQTGAPVYDQDGMMTRGTLIRHLVLPGLTGDSIRILEQICDDFPGIPVSLMGQYTPCGRALSIPGMDRKIKKKEYARVLAYMEAVGLTGYRQELGSADGAFIPAFDGTGV